MQIQLLHHVTSSRLCTGISIHSPLGRSQHFIGAKYSCSCRQVTAHSILWRINIQVPFRQVIAHSILFGRLVFRLL
jgi:hypothetical protein